MVALYQHDLTGRPLEQTLASDASSMTRALAETAAKRAAELDAILDRHAHGWSVQRIQPLERSIMRVALVEMLHPDAIPALESIPKEGAIEEAVESAKVFCGADAPGFVNGVLAAVLREVRENGSGVREDGPEAQGAPPADRPAREDQGQGDSEDEGRPT